MASGEVWVQYNDGSQITVEPSSASVKYTDSACATTRYAEQLHSTGGFSKVGEFSGNFDLGQGNPSFSSCRMFSSI